MLLLRQTVTACGRTETRVADTILRGAAALLLAVLVMAIPIETAAATDIHDLFDPGLESWKEVRFSGSTRYAPSNDTTGVRVCATTNGSASMLYREVDVDLGRTPHLNWSWRIDNVYSHGAQRTKLGDDFPARVYLTVRKSFFTRTLNYIWSSRPEDVDTWPNPFADSAMMIPLRIGADETGLWLRERVNVKQDLDKHFGAAAWRVIGVAIMSDADNAGGSASACYRELFFSE